MDKFSKGKIWMKIDESRQKLDEWWMTNHTISNIDLRSSLIFLNHHCQILIYMGPLCTKNWVEKLNWICNSTFCVWGHNWFELSRSCGWISKLNQIRKWTSFGLELPFYFTTYFIVFGLKSVIQIQLIIGFVISP